MDTPNGKERYRYLQKYCDRHGRKRTYLRRGAGLPSIPLPEPEDPGFDKAYWKALREVEIGVYLLIHKGKLVYIGSSKHMVRRVDEHRQNGCPFDQAFYISTSEGEREALEKLLIRDLSRGITVPVSLDQVPS